MPEPRLNPYVGPKPFEPGEPLFGRDRETLELRYLLTAERIVLLYSPSGAGKTSLVNAGLIPRLQDDFEIRGPTRVNIEPPPGVANRYVWSALSGLSAGEQVDPRVTWSDYLANHKWRSNPLIIFDQFEEILRVDTVDTNAKREFFEQVGEVLRDPGIWALFILREDYLAPLDPYARLIPTHFQNRYRLDRLTRASASEAIEKPAQNRSEGFAPGVVKTLVENLAKVKVAQLDGTVRDEDGDYVEPVQLQVVCFDLWNRMLDAGRTRITSDDVRDVKDALAKYYDSCVYAAARQGKAVERQIRNWFSDKLITADGVRNQVRREGDGSSGGLSGDLVQKLVDMYLVRQEPRASSIWYELAHDRLVEPVRASNKEWLEAHTEKFQKYAAQWERDPRPNLLFLGKDLAEAREWADTHKNLLTSADKEFLIESMLRQEALDREREQARTLRRWLRMALGSLLVALCFGGYAWHERNNAKLRELTAYAALSQTEDPARALYIGWRAARMGGTMPPTLEGIFATALSNGASYGILRGHQGAVHSVAWSPDGKTLASASLDGTVRLWEAATGQTLRTLQGHQGTVQSVAWSPDGKTLASASLDGMVRLWEAASGQSLRTLQGHQGAVYSVVWSPDGKTLGSASKDGTVRLWEAAGGQTLRTLQDNQGAVYSVVWSPDGKTLASGSWDTVRLWEAASGQPLRTLQGHQSSVYSVAWSPDGKTLGSASEDGTVRLWEAAGGQTLRTLQDNQGAVYSVAWSPDGKTLASASLDGMVRLWEAATGQSLRTLQGHQGGVYSVAWSPHGKTLASASLDGTVRLWEAASGQPLRTLQGHDVLAESVVWSPDGTTLASAGDDQTVRLWEAATGRSLRTLQGHEGSVNSVAWNPDGKTLASASSDQTVRLWEAASGQFLRTLQGHESRVNSVAWNPDGKTLASASSDQTVRLWEAASGRSLRTLQGREGEGRVNSIAWNPDGKSLASASPDGTVRLWQAAGGKLLRTLQYHPGGVYSVAWSSDGKSLASASPDGTVRLWQAAGGKLLRTLQGHRDPVLSVAWSPDGKRLASASSDQTVRLWEAASGQPLRTLQGHRGNVNSVAWSPDGKTLASASDDGTIKLWPGTVDGLLDQVRDRIRLFSLSKEECQRYFGSDDCPPLR